jgi:hypothetical protein
MRNLCILSAVVFSWTLIAAQEPALPAVGAVDSATVVNSDSQQIGRPSVQNASVSTDTVVPSNPENESLLPTDSGGALSRGEAADTASSQTKSTVVHETEEELFLDGGEENIIAPSAVSVPAQPASQDTDSTSTQGQELSDTATVQHDSLSEQQKLFLSHFPADTIPKTDQESKPLLIEKTQSINFAKNFKEYRSPKVAIGLSLLLPGAGQAYCHHKLKTGIFGFVEVAFIAAGAIVGYQGNKRMKKARDFADGNYSIDSLANYYSKLVKYYEGKDFDVDSQIFISYIDYGTFKNEAGAKSQSYYNYIGHEVSPYIQGWTDVTPKFDATFDPIDKNYFANEDSAYLVYYVTDQGDTSAAQFGFSEKQKEFNKKVSKANSYFRWSKNLFTMLLINHIVSAVDAGITAKAYNEKLLGKNTLWQKFNLKETIVSTPGGPAQGFSLEVRF